MINSLYRDDNDHKKNWKDIDDDDDHDHDIVKATNEGLAFHGRRCQQLHIFSTTATFEVGTCRCLSHRQK